MEVLRDRQEVQEEENDAVVHPPARGAGECRQTGPTDAEQQQSGEAAERLPGTLSLDRGRQWGAVEVPAIIEEAADHDGADETQDEDGLTMRLAAEPILGRREAEEARRMGNQPAIQRHPDGAQDDELDEVLEQQVRAAEEVDRETGQVEAGNEPAREHMDHLNAQDGEAPEDEEVHPAGRLVARQRLLADHELLLPEDVLDHGLDALGHAVETVHRGDLEQYGETPVQRARQVAEPDGEQGDKD